MFLSKEYSQIQIYTYIDSRKYFAIAQVSMLALSLYGSGAMQNGYLLESIVDKDEIFDDLMQVLEWITFDECLKRSDQLNDEKIYEQAYLFAVTKYFSHSLGFTFLGKNRMKTEFMSRKVYENYAVPFFEAAEKVIERLIIDEREIDIPYFLAYEAIELIKE